MKRLKVRNIFKRFFLAGEIIILILSLSSCSESGNKPSEHNNVLTGSELTLHDQEGGVAQASPGVEETPSEGKKFIVPIDKSLLRFKLFDDPVPQPTTNGLVHYVVEYENPASLISKEYRKSLFIPECIRLTIEKIELKRILPEDSNHEHKDREEKNKASGKRERCKNKTKREKLIFYPKGRDAEVLFMDKRHFIPLVRNLSLIAGEYEDLKIHFKKTGTLVYNDTEYKLKIKTEDVRFNEKFSVEAGKITTLHAIPWYEYNINNKSGKQKHHLWGMQEYYLVHHPKHRNKCDENKKIYVHLKIRSNGISMHNPIDKVFIQLLKIEAVRLDGTSTILNNTISEFELLSLRNGIVALMGHNMVLPGEYNYFELTIGNNHRVELNGENNPLIIEYQTQNKLRLEGPFYLRGGRITEVFLHFDPNSSIFYLPERGFIMDPFVAVTSVISMTSEQDLRMIESLGPRSNLVVSEAELIFQGTVLSNQTVLANNIYGNRMIYTDVSLKVKDQLRGTVENPDNFPLRMIGGKKEGRVLTVRGMPRFETGKTSILFLKKYGDRYSTVRGSLGKVDMEVYNGN